MPKTSAVSAKETKLCNNIYTINFSTCLSQYGRIRIAVYILHVYVYGNFLALSVNDTQMRIDIQNMYKLAFAWEVILNQG